ncbi:MAG: hypothetical protein ABSB96_04980 [Gaiellaceae bacterium]
MRRPNASEQTVRAAVENEDRRLACYVVSRLWSWLRFARQRR